MLYISYNIKKQISKEVTKMLTRELRTRQECEDFVRGCTIMGTGGGGNPARGFDKLTRALDEGLRIGWTDAKQIPDDAWVVCPFLMGSIAPKTSAGLAEIKDLGLTKVHYPNTIMAAIQELEIYTGKKIGAVIPGELGGANTPEPVAQAARLSIPCIDGDYAGRAIPEIAQMIPVLFDKPLAPLTSVDEWGNISIIKAAINEPMAERIGKFLAVAAHGLVGMAGVLLSGKECKEIAVTGTLSLCLKLGQTVQEARNRGIDVPVATAEAMAGWIIFKGRVTAKEWEDRVGYYWGTHTLTGIEEFSRQTFKVWFKNENHISWLNNKPFVMSPDLICMVDRETGEPKTNDAVAEGDIMAVLGARAPDPFLTQPKGLEVLGPKHFGFDYPYVPIQKLIS
jgi:hypothetical protein